MQLQSESREPITVYIDSPGGSVASAEVLLKLLRLPDQDSSPPCHIITAVTAQAGSAAADLLSSGDYATAYPASSILYHGLRTVEDSPLTLEKTSMLAGLLRTGNDMYANELARKIEARFSLRYVYAREQFDAVRSAAGEPGIEDLECFVEHFVPSKLSPPAKQVWERASDRYAAYRVLFEAGPRKVRRLKSTQSPVKLEAASIKAIVDFEVRRNRKDPNWGNNILDKSTRMG